MRKEAQTYGVSLSLTPEEARRQLTASGQATPHNLALQPTPFVGRSAELAALGKKLRDPHCRLLTIVGPGGTGKTRLAIEAAQGQLNTFEDGVFFVSLVPVNSPTAMVYAVSDTLGLGLLGQGEPLEQLVNHLKSKTVLLLLDNLEHLLEDLSLIRELLARALNAKLLATSREPLNLQAEHVFELQGLEVPAQAADIGSYDIGTFDAVKLFVQSARRRWPDFTIDDSNAGAVSRICDLVGGLPLALELAASWLRVLSPADVAGEIEQGIDLLAATTRDLPERHRSIRAVFDHSWALLTEQEQTVLRKLSVFRGGFRRDAALEVAGAPLPLLARLVDRSLLRTAPDGRYLRHPLVIAYTRERLDKDAEEKAQTVEKHGLYYLRLFSGRVPALRSLDRKRTIAVLEADVPNFNAAWRWAVEQARTDEIKRGVQAIQEVHHHQEAVELLTFAAERLNVADPGHQGALGHVLVGLGFRSAFLGLQEQAIDAAERGLSLVKALGDDEGVLDGLYALATGKFFVGDFRQSVLLAEEGLALARGLGHAGHTSIFLSQLAGVVKELDDLPNVEGFFEDGLAEVRRLHGYPEYLAGYLYHYATHLLHSGNLSRAQELMQESQSLFERLGHERWQSGCLNILGVAAIKLGDLDEAERLLWDALTLTERLGQKFVQATILSNLAKVATAKGDYAGAERHLARSLQIGLDIKYSFSLAAALVSLAELRIAQGEPLEAAPWLARVAQHPKAEKHERDEARRALGNLRDRLPPETLEA